VTADEINRLTSIRLKRGFQASMNPIISTITSQYYRQTYKLGQKMFARQEISPTRIINRGFPFPKPNINGVCDNLQQPEFMHNSESECVQIITLTKEGCESAGNPLLSTTALMLLRGPEPPSSNPGVKVELSSEGHFHFSDATNPYSPSTAPLGGSTFTSSGSQCSCGNILKEVHYTVKVTSTSGILDTNNEPYFKIDSMIAFPVTLTEAV